MDSTLYKLLIILNEEEKESSNWQIANTFLTNRKELQNLSIEKAASICHVSEASISRFCNLKLGITFKELKRDLPSKTDSNSQSMFHMENDSYEKLHNNLNQYVRDYSLKVSETINEFGLNFDQSDINDLVQLIKKKKNVYIFSHQTFTNLGRTIQQNLYNYNKLVYFSDDITKQEEYIEELEENDLVIILSTFGNFLNSPPDITPLIKSKKTDMILITQNPDILNTFLFDKVISFSSKSQRETGPYLMMIGIEIFLRAYAVSCK